MARGINKAIVIGNLGADPEVRYAPSGTAIANLSLATTDQWKDKQTGERQERTEWHRIVLFNKTAEIAQQYLTKGAKVYIEGRLQTRKWQDQSGIDRYSTEIVANDMQMLGGDGGGGQRQQPQPQQGGYQQPPMPGQPAPQQPPQQPQQQMPPQQPQQQQAPMGGSAPQQQPPQQQAPAQGQPGGNQGAPGPGSFDDFDDQIPF